MEPFHGPENQREVQVPIKRQEFTGATVVEKFSLVTMNSFPRIFQARELDYSLFINKRFALNEMFQQNASKFAIFYV